MSKEWLTVNRDGLRKVLGDRSPAFALCELVQNAWDEDITRVDVKLDKPKGSRDATLTVTDDAPNGFADLAHAYELFAPSKKATDATKRGRFNLGEKLVLALCKSAQIMSTTGTVTFDDRGRTRSRQHRDAGTSFEATLPLTWAQYTECLDVARSMIGPPGIVTTINGVALPEPTPVAGGRAMLPTIIADAEGTLTRSRRTAQIDVYRASGLDAGVVYEMGIPVVAIGGPYNINVQQRVPINLERDNLPSAFLRRLRAEVLNLVADELTADQANDSWVRDGLQSSQASDDAVKRVVTHRFGDNAVAYDPSDPEANARATAQGRTVVHGGHMNATEWARTKGAGLLRPAGQVTPSKRPRFDPNGDPVDTLTQDEYTAGMARIVAFTKTVGTRLIGSPIHAEVVRLRQPFAAYFGAGRVTFNLNRLGWAWFADGVTDAVMDLVIHELGHHYEGNHLSDRYYHALTDLGARMTRLALREPELFSSNAPALA
jgi:hypothetical protein